jgi:hypothetical protein
LVWVILCQLFYFLGFDCGIKKLQEHIKENKEYNGRIKSWGTFLGLQHFEGKKARLSSRMGTKMNDKRVNYSHKPTQTKQQVG